MLGCIDRCDRRSRQKWMDALRVHDKESISPLQYFPDDILFIELPKKRELVVLAKSGGCNEVPAEYDHPHFRSRCSDLFSSRRPR